MVPVAFILLIFRRPETLATAEFWADDGSVYNNALRLGWTSVVTSYGGSLIVLQRMVALLESAVPPQLAPIVGNGLALLIVALVAGFLASPRMAHFIPSTSWRAGFAIAFVLLPPTGWIFWTMACVQWFTGTYLVAMLVATPPTSRRGRIGDALGLLVAGLTGPLSIVLLPLFLLRAMRQPVWRWQAVIVSLSAALQVLELLNSYRQAAAGVDPSALPLVFGLRVVVLPIGGSELAVLPVVASGGALLFILALAVRRLPPNVLVGAAYVGLAVPFAGMNAGPWATSSLVDPGLGQQYFYLSGVVAASLIIAALARGHRAAIPIALVLMTGIIVDARVPPAPLAGWAEHSACIGGPTPCVVPVTPDPLWAVRWP